MRGIFITVKVAKSQLRRGSRSIEGSLTSSKRARGRASHLGGTSKRRKCVEQKEM